MAGDVRLDLPCVRSAGKSWRLGKGATDSTTQTGHAKPKELTMNPLASLSRAMTPMRWRLAACVVVILLSAAVMPGRAR